MTENNKNNEELKKDVNDNIDNKNKDNRNLSEKIDDAVENTFGAIEDIFYGDDFQNDIPATMRNGNGRKIVNKYQTRRNMNKRIFRKGGWKFILLSIIIVFLFGLIMELLGIW